MKFMISQGLLSKPLAEAALDAGFFDQSHFIREFRKFAGETPRVFFGLAAAGL
jgi:AraC-like DNA-binding protein